MNICAGNVMTFAGQKIIFISLILMSSCNPKPGFGAKYTNQEYCQAIYMAEGGEKSEYPFGIRSVRCEGYEECKRICENTVQNNRQRFREYGHQKYASFIEFLGSRYAPVTGRITRKERRLNPNWLRNAKFFLNKLYPGV